MNSFSDWFWLLIWTFVFVCYLMVLFQIIIDLFRDKDLSGWWKALWIIFLIIFPFLAALVYLIARGREWPSGVRARCNRLRLPPISTSSPWPARAVLLTRSPRRRLSWTVAPSAQEEFDKLKQKALAS